MRSLCFALSLILFSAQTAYAAMLWTETTKGDQVQVHWALGADQNEAVALMQSRVGMRYQTTKTCRSTGYFAYVGSITDSIYGVSCGQETNVAAIYAARLQCELSNGHCDLERIGFDAAISLKPDTHSRTNTPLSGSTPSAGDSPLPIGRLTTE